MSRSHGEEGGDNSKRMHFEGCIDQKGLLKFVLLKLSRQG
jgi:hypothetical protein